MGVRLDWVIHKHGYWRPTKGRAEQKRRGFRPTVMADHADRSPRPLALLPHRPLASPSSVDAHGHTPEQLHIQSDLRPRSASPARTALRSSHPERNDVTIIGETAHWPFSGGSACVARNADFSSLLRRPVGAC